MKISLVIPFQVSSSLSPSSFSSSSTSLTSFSLIITIIMVIIIMIIIIIRIITIITFFQLDRNDCDGDHHQITVADMFGETITMIVIWFKVANGDAKVRGNIPEQFIRFALLVEGINITPKLFGLLTLMYMYM